MAKLVQLKDSAGDIYPKAFTSTDLTSSDNLDNIRYPCFAWCNNVTNKPSANTFGWLFNPYFSVQIYFTFGSNGIAYIYIRCYANSQWYPWRQITTTAI